MNSEEKIKKSFKLVREDIKDIYQRLDELSEKVEEMRVTQGSIADKLVKKANKKAISNIVKKHKTKKSF